MPPRATNLNKPLLLTANPRLPAPGAKAAWGSLIGASLALAAAELAERIVTRALDLSCVVEHAQVVGAGAQLGESAGDYFGDLTLLLGENRSASVRSVSFSEVFLLRAEAYHRIRAEYPDLREVLTKSSQERSDTVNQLVLEGIVL